MFRALMMMLFLFLPPLAQAQDKADDSEDKTTLGTAVGTLERLTPGYRISAVAFSPDGRMLVSGSDDKTLKLWDVASGRELRTLSGHDSWVSAVVFSPDGRMLVSGSYDKTLKLWDVASGDEKATLIDFAHEGSIAITSMGYFDILRSKTARYFNVRMGDRVAGLDQYYEHFYRPDAVKLAIAGKSLTGMTSLLSVKPAPSVSIVETPSSVSNDEVTVKGEVTDQGGGIGDVRLYLNGSAIVLDRTHSLTVATGKSKSRFFSYKVRLVAGKNAIRAIAFNAENSMQSTDALHEVDAKIAARKSSLHALVIGIQKYNSPKLILKYPVVDARLMASTLRGRATGLFEGVNVVELTTKAQTTKDAITKTLQEMSRNVRPDDLFVLFIASHDTVNEGEYFLLTSNVGTLSTSLLKQTALSQDDLKGLIANVPATKKLVIIDTPNMGQLGEAAQVAIPAYGMNKNPVFRVLARAAGSTILSASTSLQEAAEGYRGHGFFTWVLAEGLRGAADLDNNGYVETHELAWYIEDRVPRLSGQVFKHKRYATANKSGQASFPVVVTK